MWKLICIQLLLIIKSYYHTNFLAMVIICTTMSLCALKYRIAPNFRGTIFSWISWFDFWSRKFSSRNLVYCGRGYVLCAYTCTSRSQHECNRCTDCTFTFRKWANVAYQICKDLCPKLPSCIKSANNHIEEMANRRQQKALKAERTARISLVRYHTSMLQAYSHMQ